MDASTYGVDLGIPPLRCLITNLFPWSGKRTVSGGQFDWGGRLPKSNGGAQRFPQIGRKSIEECIGIRELNCETYKSSRCESRAKWSGGREWNCRRLTDKSYPGDNRLIPPNSSYRRWWLAPRCRLVTSWRWIRFQGLGCSPIKVARELGSERRETVRSLSVVGVGKLRRADSSTRGPDWTYLWCICCNASCSAEYLCMEGIIAESI